MKTRGIWSPAWGRQAVPRLLYSYSSSLFHQERRIAWGGGGGSRYHRRPDQIVTLEANINWQGENVQGIGTASVCTADPVISHLLLWCVWERERARASACNTHTHISTMLYAVGIAVGSGENWRLKSLPLPFSSTLSQHTQTQGNTHAGKNACTRAHTHTHTHTINLYSLWNLIQALGMFVMPAAGPSGWFLVCAWFWGDPDGQTDKKHCTTLIILLCFYFLLTKCLLMVEYTLCLANCLFSLLETGRYCCETPFCVCIPFVTSDINHVNLLAHQINFYNCYDIMRKK